MNCNDCGLTMEGFGATHHEEQVKYFPEHIGRCCDCADELLGMPEENRTRPRPENQLPD